MKTKKIVKERLKERLLMFIGLSIEAIEFLEPNGKKYIKYRSRYRNNMIEGIVDEINKYLNGK